MIEIGSVPPILKDAPVQRRFWGILTDVSHMKHIRQIIKYVISGGLSTITTISVLYALTHWFGIWYLSSTAIAYMVGFFVSFTLQKFWTFQNNQKDKVVSQAFFYFLIVAGNLGLNTLGVYILVEKFHMWYILADILTLSFIAFESFFLYRMLFRKPN